MESVGIPHIRQAASVDENIIKLHSQDIGLTVEKTTLSLAKAKAQVVAQDHPEKFVLGADQILECNGVWYDKPKDADAARDHLKQLRGHDHRLVNGLIILRGSETVWSHVEIARLSMRDFSDAFLESYLQRSGPAILSSVGAYRLEDQGAQLFDEIDGDYFTILGLPLLPLLAFLRQEGMIET